MASSPVDSKTPANGIQHEGVLSSDEIHENVLQKHVAFFDQNKDGVVYPWETFKGFRQIGCGLLLSTFAAIFINTGHSVKTRPGKFPSHLFPIEIKNIQKAKHRSDTGVYDTEGRFVLSKFEEIFSKHAHTCLSALTAHEVMEMVKSNRKRWTMPDGLQVTQNERFYMSFANTRMVYYIKIRLELFTMEACSSTWQNRKQPLLGSRMFLPYKIISLKNGRSV